MRRLVCLNRIDNSIGGQLIMFLAEDIIVGDLLVFVVEQHVLVNVLVPMSMIYEGHRPRLVSLD